MCVFNKNRSELWIALPRKVIHLYLFIYFERFAFCRSSLSWNIWQFLAAGMFSARKPALEIIDHFSNILTDHDNGGCCTKRIFAWLLLIYSFQFISAFQPRWAIPAVAEFLFSSCDLEHWPKSKVIWFKSYCSETQTNTHTHRTSCSTWTTKVVGKKVINSVSPPRSAIGAIYCSVCLKEESHGGYI